MRWDPGGQLLQVCPGHSQLQTESPVPWEPPSARQTSTVGYPVGELIRNVES